MTMYSGDEMYGDDVTSGPWLEGALDDACDACGAEPGEECRPGCIGLAALEDETSGGAA